VARKKEFLYSKNFFEKKAWKKSLYVCGIDEVGRGCLAGPLVVCAAILRQSAKHKLLKDSKVLTEEQRESVYVWLTKNSFYSIVILSNRIIDDLNIYQATLNSMKKAFLQLLETIPFKQEQIKYLLIDAIPLKLNNSYVHKNLETVSINFGESVSTSIAAASIIAKVTRDRLMQKVNPIFPAFKLDQHKGYGTTSHRQIINENGISILHRQTFVQKLIKVKKNDKQNSLF